jgi:hypothetical protein
VNFRKIVRPVRRTSNDGRRRLSGVDLRRGNGSAREPPQTLLECEGKANDTQPPEILRDRGQSLEDEFFRREDKRLTERLNELRAAEAIREALRKASGITEPAVLEKLMELGIRAETVAALSSSRSSRWHGPIARSMPRSVALLLNGRGRSGLNDRTFARGLARSPPRPQTSHRVDAPGPGHVRATRPRRGRSSQDGVAGSSARGSRRNRRSVRRWFEDFGSGGGDAGQARGRFSLQPISTRWWSRHRRDRNADVRSGRA